VKLLKWFTPVDGMEEPLFTVTRDGQQVQYLGAHYKRPGATDADYLKLASGESLTWKVDLTEFYDLSQTGDYKVQFNVGPMQSTELKVAIEGRTSGPKVPAPDVGTASLAYRSCDATQSGLVAQAVSGASNYANGAVTYLGGTPSGTPRYTTWFGAFSSGGWSTAKSHFTAIKDAFDTKPVTIDCGCRKKYYAYVYPTQPYIIYVCNVFWTAPMTGTDSKSGTLIHEMSHFNVVAGTDDWVYGQSGAKSLAISNPTNALDNADSHEYFAENNPFQN
jgi:peptidyl-Lys metalloendopeptidase